LANEFKHTDVGDEITKAEYHSITGHEADGQAAGDILYCDGTYWKRVAIGANGLYLKAAAVPYWEAILDADIPATIARDAEVAADIATHAAIAAAHHTKTVDASELTAGELADARIPAAIARDAEVATAVSDHAALTTGVHAFNKSCKVYNSAAQACANGVVVLLAFNSESWDTDTMHDTVTNNSRITCKTAGIYMISMYLDFVNNATGCRRILPKYNGTAWLDDLTLPTSPSVAFRASHVLFMVLAVNDYIEFYAYQDSGVSLNATANCRFGAARIA